MFEHLRVIELASVLAGPSVGQFFAELGAEVIKIENPNTGGDVTRSWKSPSEPADDDRSAYFSCCNWGKKSVCLDLSDAQQLQSLHRLVRTADVMITSYKPGDAEKLKVDFTSILNINPRIVYGEITGYGTGDDRVGYDAVIQAEAGFMSINGEPDGGPLKMPVALIDVLAAHQLKEGLLLALMARIKDNRGRCVSVSLFDAAVASLVNQATNWLVAGQVPVRQGSSHPNIAPYGDSFLSRDGKQIMLAVGSDRQFADLCDILGRADWASQPEFATNVLRVSNREQLRSRLAGRFSQMEADELLRQFRERKIPAGLIRNIREVFELPETSAILLRGVSFTGVRHIVAGGLSVQRALSPPPVLGAHTSEVLSELN